MLTVLTVEDIMEWNRCYKNSRNEFADIYKLSATDKMYGSFHLLINYYFFKENCINALKKLKPIVATDNFLQINETKEWLLFHEWLGKRMTAFLADHNIDFENSTLEIPGLQLLIELIPFIPIAAFCEIFQVLYWELQLHLPEKERVYDTSVKHSLRLPDVRVKEWLEKVG